jgi:hypothetical protein
MNQGLFDQKTKKKKSGAAIAIQVLMLEALV